MYTICDTSDFEFSVCNLLLRSRNNNSDLQQARVLRPLQGTRRELVRTLFPSTHSLDAILTTTHFSAIRRRLLESSRRTTRSIPIQVPKHRLSEPHIPSQYRRVVGPSSLHLIGGLEHLLSVSIFRSGSVCLDVINQTWSPMFDMINIFEVFLPQLLRYPNPTDPLNGEAAALLMRDSKAYDAKVKGGFL